MASHLPAKAAKALANLSHQETRLNLARCGLADWHLSLIDWSKLNHIRSIDLSGNSLCSIPVKVFEQWSWVEELSLYKNQIAEIPCGALLFLRKLHTLLLSDNRLRSLPSDIGKCKCLRVISLASNRFACIPPQLCLVKQLESVDLENNNLSGSHLAASKSSATLLAHLASFPNVGLLGFGAMQEDAATANVSVQLRTRSGVETRRLHSEMLSREPKFRCWRADSAAEFGSSNLSVEAMNAILSFFYCGVLSAAKQVFEEVAAFVREQQLESMMHLLEVSSKEEDEHVMVDDVQSLGVHLERLLASSAGDLEIVCGDGASLFAHSSILSSRVRFFQRVLCSGTWKESAERRVKVEFGSDVVLALLHWVYCDSIPFECCDACDMLEAANFFGMDDLSLELETCISDELDPTNCEFVLQVAKQLSCHTLIKLSSSYARLNGIKASI